MTAVTLKTHAAPFICGEEKSSSSYLADLPPGFLPFDEFASRFSLGGTSTEQVHEKTKALSQAMQSDAVKGLEMLWDADQEVLAGYERFIPAIESLAPELAGRLEAGGRIFLVGSGSSGRVGIDVAAKCRLPEQVRGVIAGGDSAMIRAKEGFEDSEADGEKCLKAFDLKPEDAVFLISGSGSASFNVGCGHFAANQGARVYYFYNSKEVPSRTARLFSRDNNPVRPLELDIGPQAIGGSTRLQAASLAEMCLGALLGTAVLHREGEEASSYPGDLLRKMREGNRLIRDQLEPIAQFAKKEAAVFSSPNANFRRLQDETSQGYVTFVGDKNTLREILIDATETSPTFSTNPIRREADVHRKRAEFRAYLVGETDNRQAWKALLGRESGDEEDTDQYLLAVGAEGKNSYSNRPSGPGNFLIGVAKAADFSEIPGELFQLLQKASEEGGETGMILFSGTKSGLSPDAFPHAVFLEEVPGDRFGLVETLLLKQVLNLISNGSMVLMNKVHGNRMIDVRAANQKLIDRILRLIKEVWGDFQQPMPLGDRELYHFAAHICALKGSAQDLGMYTPSAVKIALAMLNLGKKPVPGEFEETVRFLADRQERLDFLFEPAYTLCIDGGGSKTLLQVVDARGEIVPLTKNGITAEIFARTFKEQGD